MLKVRLKTIRNFKDSFENALFFSVILTLTTGLATLVYLSFKLWDVALVSANLLVALLVLNLVLLAFIQVCDLMVCWIKVHRRLNAKNRASNKKEVKMHPLMKIKRFYHVMATYSF